MAETLQESFMQEVLFLAVEISVVFGEKQEGIKGLSTGQLCRQR